MNTIAAPKMEDDVMQPQRIHEDVPVSSSTGLAFMAWQVATSVVMSSTAVLRRSMSSPVGAARRNVGNRQSEATRAKYGVADARLKVHLQRNSGGLVAALASES